MGKLFNINGFLPYLIVIFLNAFVDLGHKITIQNSIFKTTDGSEQVILTAIVNALILLPFILLFSPAGFISDKYPKSRVMQISAIIAVLLTSLITLFYYLGLFWLAFAMTFLLAVQSALYSPAKFGYIRELVGNERLSAANGLVQATTMVAILGSTFAFSFLFEGRLAGFDYHNESELIRQIAPLGWFLIGAAVLELALTFLLPQLSEVDENKHFELARYRRGDYLKKNLATVYSHPTIWLSIIGLAVFWAISQVLLASFPAFAKETLSMTDTVIIQGMMAFAGIGIMIGSIVSGRLSSHHIETGFLPLGAFGIALCLFIMPLLGSVLAHSLNFLALGVFGGLFVVPLNALIQFHAKEQELGIVLAANNLIQTSVMLLFLILTVVFSFYGLDSQDLITLLLWVAIIGGGYTLYHLPQSFLRLILSRLIATKYRLQVQGFENIPETGGVLILGNHISYIDWAILQMACPRQLHFVIDKGYYDRWYLNWFIRHFGAIPISKGASQTALKTITQLLNKGQVVCLFPEGKISRSGQLNPFKHGYEKAAIGADALILPFYIHGLWGSHFSRSSANLKAKKSLRNRRDLVISFGQTLPINTSAEQLKQQISELSIHSWQLYSQTLPNLACAWLRQAKSALHQIAVIETATDKHYTQANILNQGLAIAALIKRQSHEQNIALLLNHSEIGLAAQLGVLMRAKTIVNLNYEAHETLIKSALEKAQIQNLYTTRDFFDQLCLQRPELSQLFSELKIHFICDYLMAEKPYRRFYRASLIRFLPCSLLEKLILKNTDREALAAIVFADPETHLGVKLSHRNLLINIKQCAQLLNTESDDSLLASIPLFTSYGLTIHSLLPLIEGIRLICPADTQDSLSQCQAIEKYHVSILCSSADNLSRLENNQNVEAQMLSNLRHLFSNSDDLPEQLIQAFKLKFNQVIHKGYGRTQTSPLASVNLAQHKPAEVSADLNRPIGNPVGLPVPGSRFRIVSNKDNASGSYTDLNIGEVGEILIGGPQVMIGYLADEEKTAMDIVEEKGIRWFKSGDQGYLDEDGFLNLLQQESSDLKN